VALGAIVVGGRQSGSRCQGVQAGPAVYFPLANSSASQVWGHFLANASGLPYILGEEVDMSYLGRSGSSAGEGQTVLGGGGGGAGGVLSFFHFLLASGVGVAGRGGTRPTRGSCGLLWDTRALGRERGLSG